MNLNEFSMKLVFRYLQIKTMIDNGDHGGHSLEHLQQALQDTERYLLIDPEYITISPFGIDAMARYIAFDYGDIWTVAPKVRGQLDVAAKHVPNKNVKRVVVLNPHKPKSEELVFFDNPREITNHILFGRKFGVKEVDGLLRWKPSIGSPQACPDVLLELPENLGISRNHFTVSDGVLTNVSNFRLHSTEGWYLGKDEQCSASGLTVNIYSELFLNVSTQDLFTPAKAQEVFEKFVNLLGGRKLFNGFKPELSGIMKASADLKTVSAALAPEQRKQIGVISSVN